MSPIIENMDRLVRDIPAMPAVAQKVMHMLGDPRTTNTSLGETLSADMSMASRILQMANSPFFGARQKITSISQAIFVLGHSALRSLIITVCTKGIFKSPGLMEEKTWEHSLGAGVAARCLAEKTRTSDPDEAFLGGLLHDIGRMILIVVHRADYQKIFEKDYNQNMPRAGVLALEKQEFGYDHAEIGARVINKWKLPLLYARIARRHHTENATLLTQEEDPKAVALGCISNQIAHRLGLGGGLGPNEEVDLEKSPFNQVLALDAALIQSVLENTEQTAREFQDQFKL